MEKLLNEYRLFMQSIISNYPQFTSGSTASGMGKRLGELQVFIELYNKKSTEKINELLILDNGAYPNLKDELVAMGKEQFNAFTKDKFPFLNPI